MYFINLEKKYLCNIKKENDGPEYVACPWGSGRKIQDNEDL